MAKDIFACWTDVSRKIANARRVFLFFDFDGTLAPIAPRPELVDLDGKVKESLRVLSGKPGCTLGIISGRGLDDLRQMVGVDGILYAGNHGFEVKGPGIEYVNPEAAACRKVMEEVARTLVRDTKEIPGAIVEDKVYSLSAHYRQCAKGDVLKVKDIVDQATKGYRADKQLRVTSGKKVIEIRPHTDWHKGRIVEWLVERCAQGARAGTIVWYAGDDLTDEDAFAAVNTMGGITVLAGAADRATGAEYVLRSQSAMLPLLAKLQEV